MFLVRFKGYDYYCHAVSLSGTDPTKRRICREQQKSGVGEAHAGNAENAEFHEAQGHQHVVLKSIETPSDDNELGAAQEGFTKYGREYERSQRKSRMHRLLAVRTRRQQIKLAQHLEMQDLSDQYDEVSVARCLNVLYIAMLSIPFVPLCPKHSLSHMECTLENNIICTSNILNAARKVMARSTCTLITTAFIL